MPTHSSSSTDTQLTPELAEQTMALFVQRLVLATHKAFDLMDAAGDATSLAAAARVAGTLVTHVRHCLAFKTSARPAARPAAPRVDPADRVPVPVRGDAVSAGASARGEVVSSAGATAAVVPAAVPAGHIAPRPDAHRPAPPLAPAGAPGPLAVPAASGLQVRPAAAAVSRVLGVVSPGSSPGPSFSGGTPLPARR